MRHFIEIVEHELLHELNRNKAEVSALKDLSAQHGEDDETHNVPFLDSVAAYFKPRGFKRIGYGAFGAVFEHPGLDYVIKVFRKDPAYLAFVNLCLDQKDNPYLPKFRGRFIRMDKDHYAVRMERLDVQPDQDLCFAICGYAYGLRYRNQLALQHKDELDAQWPGLSATVGQVVDLAVENGYSIDFEDRNIMRRGETPVLVDPLA